MKHCSDLPITAVINFKFRLDSITTVVPNKATHLWVLIATFKLIKRFDLHVFSKIPRRVKFPPYPVCRLFPSCKMEHLKLNFKHLITGIMMKQL